MLLSCVTTRHGQTSRGAMERQKTRMGPVGHQTQAEEGAGDPVRRAKKACTGRVITTSATAECLVKKHKPDAHLNELEAKLL